MRKLKAEDVEILVIAEEETEHFTDPIFAYDPGTHDAFQEMVDKHGLWGWCHVTVRVSWRGLVGKGYLGGCSYESEEEFRKCDYYQQTLDQALDDLNADVEAWLLAADEARSELALTSKEAMRRREMYKGLHWRGVLECPECRADLRDHKNGVPGMRTIGIYSREQDRTVRWQCPDCSATWDRK